VVILLLGAGVLYAAVNLAGHLSRQLSRPIDELVGWTQLIRRHEPLRSARRHAVLRFEALRQALRDLAAALAAAREPRARSRAAACVPRSRASRRARDQESADLDADRVDQMRRTVGPLDGRTRDAVQVLEAETDRLERLAKEFSEFGRLPEGPQSEVDLVELLEELGARRPRGRPRQRARERRTTLAAGPLRAAAARLRQPLSQCRRVDAGAPRHRCDRDGRPLRSRGHDRRPRSRHPRRPAPACVRTVLHNEPTHRLGLALVRVTLEAHRGTISVGETPAAALRSRIVFPPARS